VGTKLFEGQISSIMIFSEFDANSNTMTKTFDVTVSTELDEIDGVEASESDEGDSDEFDTVSDPLTEQKHDKAQLHEDVPRPSSRSLLTQGHSHGEESAPSLRQIPGMTCMIKAPEAI
jgi:hypothetical protein